MAARTRSSSGAQARRNASARAAVVVGLLSLLTVPAAVAATRWSTRYELLHAAFAIPVGILLGLVALSLARRAGDRIARSLGRAPGAGAAKAGRRLGVAGILVALTAAGSVAVYELLAYVSS